MDGSLARVTAPVGEPITLSETKEFCGVTTPMDDWLLTSLMTAARQQFEGPDSWVGRALLTQTWDYSLADFPRVCDDPHDLLPGLRVPLPPLSSVTVITYMDPNGDQQVLDPGAYTVLTTTTPGRIVPAAGTTWPATLCRPESVIVRFVAGYGNAGSVPADIKTWLKQGVAYLYENRALGALPDPFFWAIARYKVEWPL